MPKLVAVFGWTVLLVPLAAVISPGFQEQSTFGDATFRVPSGWRGIERNGRFMIWPGNLPPGQEVGVLVEPGQDLIGDFATLFERWVQFSTPGNKPARAGPIKRIPGNGIETLTQVVSLGSGAEQEIWMYVATNTGGRFESYIIVSNPADLFQRYDADLRTFISSLRYGSVRPRASPGEASAASNDGPLRYRSAENIGQVQQRLPSLPPLERRPGWAIGRIVDRRGNAVENCEVAIHTGLYPFRWYGAATVPCENGRYEVDLPKGLFSVHGYAHINYEGLTYRMELFPLDGRDWRRKEPADKGIIRDFVLVGSGVRSGEQPNEWGTTNIGGAVTIEWWGVQPAGHVAEVTLTPIAPLLDGGPPRVITRTDAIVFTMTDVPLGKYQVSVKVDGRPRDFHIRHTNGGPIIGRGPLIFLPNDADTWGTKRVRVLVR